MKQSLKNSLLLSLLALSSTTWSIAPVCAANVPLEFNLDTMVVTATRTQMSVKETPS